MVCAGITFVYSDQVIRSVVVHFARRISRQFEFQQDTTR